MNPNHSSFENTEREGHIETGYDGQNKILSTGADTARLFGSRNEPTAARANSTKSLESLPDSAAFSLVQREAAFYQQRIRALTADLALVEERLRRRLSSDLHDGLDQTIL